MQKKKKILTIEEGNSAAYKRKDYSIRISLINIKIYMKIPKTNKCI